MADEHVNRPFDAPHQLCAVGGADRGAFGQDVYGDLLTVAYADVPVSAAASVSSTVAKIAPLVPFVLCSILLLFLMVVATSEDLTPEKTQRSACRDPRVPR